MRIRAEPLQALLLHATTATTVDSPEVKREGDVQVATRKIADTTRSAIIPRAMRSAARPADRFFARRISVTIRANGSPSTAVIVRRGEKPVTRYASLSCAAVVRRVSIHELQARSTEAQPPDSPRRTAGCAPRYRPFLPTHFPEEPHDKGSSRNRMGEVVGERRRYRHASTDRLTAREP